MDGAIRLAINNVDIIDQSMWDDVDQLWSYIANMITDLEKTGCARTYFPDQAIELSFRRLRGGRVLVRSVCHTARAAVIEEERLVSSLRKAALDFFDATSRLVPMGYPEQIARLSGTSS